MDERMNELIAVGASVTANCRPCLEYHVEKARAAGAEAEEITQAITVGRMVRKGAAGKFDELAASLTEAAATSQARPGGCCG
jgi:AhpD family alkylhydroperoxidase